MVRTNPGSRFTPEHTIGHFKSLAIMNKAAISTVAAFMDSGFSGGVQGSSELKDNFIRVQEKSTWIDKLKSQQPLGKGVA